MSNEIEAVVMSKTKSTVTGRVGMNVLCRSMHDFTGYRPAIIISPGTLNGTWQAKILFNDNEEDISDPKIDTAGLTRRLKLYPKSIRPGERQPAGCTDMIWLETADIASDAGGGNHEAVSEMQNQIETLAIEVARLSETSAEQAIHKADESLLLANKVIDKLAEQNKRFTARLDEMEQNSTLMAEAVGKLSQMVEDLLNQKSKSAANPSAKG